VKIGIVPNHGPITARQRLNLVRQLISARHFCAINQNRDDQNRPTESGSNVDPYEVVWVIKSRCILRHRSEPARSDHYKQDFALLDLTVKMLDKVDTERDVVDVFENVLGRIHARGDRKSALQSRRCHHVDSTERFVEGQRTLSFLRDR
jgi:hypothetical protein